MRVLLVLAAVAAMGWLGHDIISERIPTPCEPASACPMVVPESPTCIPAPIPATYDDTAIRAEIATLRRELNTLKSEVHAKKPEPTIGVCVDGKCDGFTDNSGVRYVRGTDGKYRRAS